MASLVFIQENAPATDIPSSEGEVTETKDANNDSENPTSDNTPAEASSSQVPDELPQEGDSAKETSADAGAADETNKEQEEVEGKGKEDAIGNPNQLEERLDHIELEVSACVLR